LTPNSCVPHPQYQPWIDSDRSDDVAICILPTPAPAEIEPITLNANPSVPESSDFPLDVAGWGRIYDDDFDNVGTDIPYVTTLDYVTNLECTTQYDFPSSVITNAMLCAIDVAESVCQGDSGKRFTCLSKSKHIDSTELETEFICKPPCIISSQAGLLFWEKAMVEC
jgi:hypothetical protein